MAGYEEIRDMYEKGITLQSGVHLTKEDLWEINHIYRIKSGMDSYEYVSEQLSEVDDDYDFPEIKDTAFYEEIIDRVWDTVTGQDVTDVVVYMVKEYKKM